jgi:hypothetical protein
MTQQLTTNPKTHVIIFYDKSTQFITSREQELLFSTSQDFVRVSGQVIAVKNISKVLTTQEYYQQYPETRPASYEKSDGSNEEHLQDVQYLIAEIKKEVAKPDGRGFINWNNATLYKWENRLLRREDIISDGGIKDPVRYHYWQVARNAWSKKLDQIEYAKKQAEPPVEARSISYDRVKNL